MSNKRSLSLKAYRGDFKTLLAFNLPSAQSKGLAGFTIECHPPRGKAYYLYNTLQFEHPGKHAQVDSEPANSTVNSPIHKFRWLHVPGSAHQGLTPVAGRYRYVVTPRYFDQQNHLLPLEPALAAEISVEVGPFEKAGLSLGFTRGYVQSQAFVRHFGSKASLQPHHRGLWFDTTDEGGKRQDGTAWTYEEAYAWLGHTARLRISEFLDSVERDPDQFLEVFAYDLNEPDLCRRLLALAGEGRLRIILDDSATHHEKTAPGKLEDAFEREFAKTAKPPAAIMRGHFGRYAHDKVFIAHTKDAALRVLTGSTNFSVTGLYVNSNHVVIYDNHDVADQYHKLFYAAWTGEVSRDRFIRSPFAKQHYAAPKAVPATSITFAPHSEQDAKDILDGIVARVRAEEARKDGSVLFAVMELDHGQSPIWDELRQLHAKENLMSFGISDSDSTVSLYEPGKPGGVIVTGKPGHSFLPAPFDQVPVVGIGHQIHHKFVVCGFNTPHAVVYCGSSNLAVGGESQNGDNLLEIRDQDVATVFAIEALQLVDHFQFLDRMRPAVAGTAALTKMPASKEAAAKAHHWYLATNDGWKDAYYNAQDIHARDRELFGGTLE